MMRISLLLLALVAVTTTAVDAQETRDIDQLEYRRGVYLEPPSFEPYTGPVEGRYEDGTLRLRGNLVDGQWDGLREEFYELGTLKARENYSDGVLDGPFEVYFRKGAPSVMGSYSEGRLDGDYESFWLRQPAEVGHYSDGRMCGEWTTYFPRSSYGLRVESVDEYAPCPSTGG